MGFFVDDDQAVMWRGPMLHKALEQFRGCALGKPDFLMLDLHRHRRRRDVDRSVRARAEVLVVTTPQVAASVGPRAAVLARQLRLPVRGVVEKPVVVHRRRRQAV